MLLSPQAPQLSIHFYVKDALLRDRKIREKADHPAGSKPTTSRALLCRDVLYRCATAAAHLNLDTKPFQHSKQGVVRKEAAVGRPLLRPIRLKDLERGRSGWTEFRTEKARFRSIGDRRRLPRSAQPGPTRLWPSSRPRSGRGGISGKKRAHVSDRAQQRCGFIFLTGRSFAGGTMRKVLTSKTLTRKVLTRKVIMR